MTATKTYPTLRAYVDAQPRSVTQKDIAARLGIYLSGKRFPSSVTAFRICQRCGVPLHRLLRTA
jgi:transcriptional regulator with XRE-family HTH domain